MLDTELARGVHASGILKFKLIGHALYIEVVRALNLFITIAFNDAFTTQLKGFIVRHRVELGFSDA